jgi:hypothetical protein
LPSQRVRTHHASRYQTTLDAMRSPLLSMLGQIAPNGLTDQRRHASVLRSNILDVVASFSLASQATPLMFSGTVGPSAIPVTLEIDSISFDVPIPTGGRPLLQLPYGISGDPTLSGQGVSFSILVSGSLTFAGTNVPFAPPVNGQPPASCASSTPNVCWGTGIQFAATGSSLEISSLTTTEPYGVGIGTISGVDFALNNIGIRPARSLMAWFRNRPLGRSS